MNVIRIKAHFSRVSDAGEPEEWVWQTENPIEDYTPKQDEAIAACSSSISERGNVEGYFASLREAIEDYTDWLLEREEYVDGGGSHAFF